MTSKTSLFLLNKINYFYLHWFIAKKSVWSNKGKGRCDFELVSPNLCQHIFGFHLCNTVVTVDLFVAALLLFSVAAAAAAAVAAPDVVAVGKNVQC